MAFVCCPTVQIGDGVLVPRDFAVVRRACDEAMLEVDWKWSRMPTTAGRFGFVQDTEVR